MAARSEVSDWNSSKPYSKNDLFSQQSFVTGLSYRLVDLTTVAIAALLSGLMLFAGSSWLNSSYQAAILISLLLSFIVFERYGLYMPWRGRSLYDQIGVLALAWATLFLLLLVSAFLLHVSDQFSRTWAVSWFFFGFLLLLAARTTTMFALRAVRSRGWNRKSIIIVGAGSWGRKVADNIQSTEWLGLDVKCFLDPDEKYHGENINGIRVRGHYDALPEILRQDEIDDVWICMPIHREDSGTIIDHVSNVLYLLRHSTVTKRLVPDLMEMRVLERPIIEVAGMPLINLDSSPLHGLNKLMKKIEDVLLGSLMLLLLLPLMLIIAVVIKLTSPGPVLFSQLRHGWDGRLIRVHKFRTMYMHSEENGKVTQARRDDVRVTRVGQFLRSTSLDEIPQFFNVLMGDMSIVGPRPHALSHNDYYKNHIDSYMQRHKVKPGITGWAQINGWRGETDTLEKMKRRVELDLFYIESWSLWFDLKIIFLTFFIGFRGKNAY